MSESNNVKFVESNGKWLWKRYDEQGSVIFKSPEFDTERLAREDYEANGGETPTPTEVTPEGGTTAPIETNTAGNTAPEGELNAGTTAPETETGVVA
jgi:hypothetical protein